jgi:ATP synthase protein I
MASREDQDNRQGNESPLSSYVKAVRSAGPLFGAGIQLAAAIILMFFLGRWLDTKLGTSPWLMLVGIFFGLGAGMYNFFRLVSTIDDRDKQTPGTKRNPQQ